MKYVVLALSMTLAIPAFARNGEVDQQGYLHVEGMDALHDQTINQYDDVEFPPQHYLVKLPQGYKLSAVDVVADGDAICGLSDYNSRTQTFKIHGYDLETDAGSCDVKLSIWDSNARKYIKVTYNIYQVGT